MTEVQSDQSSAPPLTGSTSKVTGAPTPIKLGDTELLMNPLTDVDYGEYENWMRARVITIAEDAIRANPQLSEEARKAYRHQAMEVSARLTFTSVEGMQVMASWDGATMLIWLGLRKHQPKMTRDDVRRLLSDPEVLVHAMSRFDAVNSLDDFAPKKSPEFKGARAGAKGKPRTKIAKAAQQVADTISQPAIATTSTAPSPENTDGGPTPYPG